MRQAAHAVAPAWKEEVNRRLAAHKDRKANPGEAQQQPEAQPAPGSIAAKAAARVAARYAKAPSYSEMLAEEARAAVRAAEAASKAALEAQAVAESVLAGLEAASTHQDWEPEFSAAPEPQKSAQQWSAPQWSSPEWTPEPVREPVLVPQRVMAAAPMVSPAPVAAPVAVASPAEAPIAKAPAARKTSRKPAPKEEPVTPIAYEIRWDSDLPAREPAAPSYPTHGGSTFAAREQHEWEAPQMHEGFNSRAYEVVEPAQPIHANLIEFPRELVATRKLRPRRAEGPYAEQVEAERQLSIFEVEPWTISTDPEATGSAAEAASTWVGPDWSGIELDEEPQIEDFAPAPDYARAYSDVHAGAAQATWNDAPMQAQQASSLNEALPMASLGRRMLAGIVDLSLIGAAFVCAALIASLSAKAMPSPRQMALESAFAFALTAAFYLAIFFTLGKRTPGMKYASLEIRTFAGQLPTREQRLQRMVALLVSLAPAGIGAAWAVFDEHHLCWHDRLSGTYVRKG